MQEVAGANTRQEMLVQGREQGERATGNAHFSDEKCNTHQFYLSSHASTDYPGLPIIIIIFVIIIIAIHIIITLILGVHGG
jgi:hypothetical protein